MTWTTPEVQRPERASVAGERAALEAALDHQRATLMHKCGGLTGEQLARRPVGRSTLSLLGMVRHLADVERWWFRTQFAGEADVWIFFTEENPDGDFDDGTAESAPGDFEIWHREVAGARAAIEGRSLDDTFQRPHGGQRADLRWLFLHMIEEYARHNGHADLIREHIDGRTGE